MAKSVISRYFNLDAIISVGYRVNSKRGVLFRIWATQLLKEYLINGFALNQQRLQQQAEKLNELKKTIKILYSVLKFKELANRESEGLLKIISDYYYALVALTLMIAVSKSEDKETMIKVTLNLINRLTIKDQT